MNIEKQLQLFREDNIKELLFFWFASDNIKDYDFIERTKDIFSFLEKIKDSSIIDINTDICEFKVDKQELLGKRSIQLLISDSTSYIIKYAIRLDVIHTHKKMFSIENVESERKVEFDSPQHLIDYINSL